MSRHASLRGGSLFYALSCPPYYPDCFAMGLLASSIGWMSASSSQRANIIDNPNANLRRPSAAHKDFSVRPGLSQSPAPEQRQRTTPSVKHIGPNATAMGKKCKPTMKRLANRAERSPALRYLGKPKRNKTISSAIEPNKNQI